jgi:1-acyl-sn-glycerol-3-phosphate acyltransferase
MGSSPTELKLAEATETVLEVVRQLLGELGNTRSLAELGPGSHLDRDLGLGSLERVELMVRLNAQFRVRLPEQAFTNAETVEHLVRAVLRSPAGVPEPPAARRPTERRAERAAPAAGVENAETLADVLRYRGSVQASEPHVWLEPAAADEAAAARGPGERALTYGALLNQALQVAKALEYRGLARGAPVALMLPTGEEFLFSFFGVMLAGGVPVPLYPPFRADRIEEYAARQAAILRNAEAGFLITFREAGRLARLLKSSAPSVRAVLEASRLLDARTPPVHAVRHEIRGEDIAFLQYTSGSTGQPKGVMVSHRNLLANLRAIGRALEVRGNDTAVSWLPLYHDMGLIGTWLMPLFFGFPLALSSPLTFLTRPESWLWAIHRHRATLTGAPNFAFELCLRKLDDGALDGLDLSSLRGAMNGAETVLPETLERFADRFARYGLRPEALQPVYGLAEATLAVSVPPLERRARVDRIERGSFESAGRAVPRPDDPRALAFVSVGRPITGEVRIADERGGDAGERAEGAIWVRGPSVTRGYYRNPEATAAIQRPDGWLDTGDRGYQADGELFITGRSKDIIIKAGRNLYPHEIEELASRVAGVRRGCVVAFGSPDPVAGTERLVVVAEVRHGGDAALIEAEIVAGLGEALGFPPDSVKLVPPRTIPKTSSGKLRRAETRRLYLEGKLDGREPPAWLQLTRLTARAEAAGAARSIRAIARRALEFVYALYVLVVFFVVLIPISLLVRLAPNPRAASRLVRRGSRAFLAIAGCRIRLEGREQLERLRQQRPAGPYIFAANHTSYIDVLILLAALPFDYRFSAKKELGGWPLLGVVIRRMGNLLFDRDDPEARLRQVDQLKQALARGESVLVFPEGTFTPVGGLRPFQLGAFKVAVETGQPICPIALRGAREILRDGTFLPRPGRVTLTVCSPLEPAGTTWQEMVRLRDATRAAIAAPAGEPLL